MRERGGEQGACHAIWLQARHGGTDDPHNGHPKIHHGGRIGVGELDDVQDEEERLFKLSTRVRGNGNIGETSTLINQAFEIIGREAGKARLAFLIIDKADSLAANRSTNQSHHEDKVAVNTLIQKIDDVRRFNGRVLVIFCTNRLEAIDPAILRRACM